MKVAKALKLGHDGISHAAIDMLCTLVRILKHLIVLDKTTLGI